MAGNIVPVVVDRDFLKKVSNFPETIYNLYPTDKLYTLLKTLLGDSGTGQLNLVQTSALITQNLNGIEFSDLDDIVGSLLNTYRLPKEQYNLINNPDPYTDQLPRSSWDAIGLGDTAFRERLSLMLTAINSGATVLGVTLLAEAILGCRVRIVEQWKYNLNTSTQSPALNFNTSSPTEFVIIPFGDNILTQDQISAVAEMVDLLMPSNSIVNVYSSANSGEIATSIRQTVSDSEWFEFDKYVTTGAVNPTVNPINQSVFPTQYWLNPSQTTVAPIFAHRRASEESIDLSPNVATVTTFIYPQPNDLTQIQPIGSPGTQRNVQGGTNYGNWISVGLADSPDNFPDGKYFGDPNHYSIYTTTTNLSSTSALSALTSLTVSSTIPSTTPKIGTGSLTATSGMVYSFTYTGYNSSTFTGCVFSGNQADTVSNGAVVNIQLFYNFEYASQSDYLTYLQKMVNKLGGQFNSTLSQYRLPISNTYIVSNPIPAQEILLSPLVNIVATAYGAL